MHHRDNGHGDETNTLCDSRLAADAIPWYEAQLGAMLHEDVAGSLLRVDAYAV